MQTCGSSLFSSSPCFYHCQSTFIHWWTYVSLPYNVTNIFPLQNSYQTNSRIQKNYKKRRQINVTQMSKAYSCILSRFLLLHRFQTASLSTLRLHSVQFPLCLKPKQATRAHQLLHVNRIVKYSCLRGNTRPGRSLFSISCDRGKVSCGLSESTIWGRGRLLYIAGGLFTRRSSSSQVRPFKGFRCEQTAYQVVWVRSSMGTSGHRLELN